MIWKSFVIRRKLREIKEKMSKTIVSTTADLAEKGFHPVSTGKDGKPRINASNFSKYIKDTDYFQKILFRVTAKMAAAKERMKSEMKTASAERKAELKTLAPAVTVKTNKSEGITFDESLLAEYRAALEYRMKTMVEWYNGALKAREFKKALKKLDSQGNFTFDTVTKGGKTMRMLATEKRTNNAINIPRYFNQDFLNLIASSQEMQDVAEVLMNADGTLRDAMPQGLANKVLRLYLQRTGGYKLSANKSGKGTVLRFDLTNGGGKDIADLLGEKVLSDIEKEKPNFDRSDLAYTGLGIIISKFALPSTDDDKKALRDYYNETVARRGDFGASILDAAIDESTKEIRAA